MKTILIFEPLAGGHRANYIRWLQDVCPEYSDCRFVFFTAENAGDLQLEGTGWWRKQKRLYDLFRQACKKYKPDHVLILELTHLELPLILFGSPVPLSAILFIQYPELPVGLKKGSKHWKTRLLLWRAPVKNLFLLNGEKSCRYLTEHFSKSARFIPIPDPVPEAKPDPGFVMRDAYGIAGDRKVFLFFGAISRRKGADVLFAALRQLTPEVAEHNAFIFCGEPEASYKENFQHLVAEVQDLGVVELHIESTFVSDERMMALFEQSDVVLMPYTRPEYSSGILALAAKARTPVIGPDAGLLGRLIMENKLGTSCAETPAALAECIAMAAECPPEVDKELCTIFVQKSRPKEFARTILNAVCYEG